MTDGHREVTDLSWQRDFSRDDRVMTRLTVGLDPSDGCPSARIFLARLAGRARKESMDEEISETSFL